MKNKILLFAFLLLLIGCQESIKYQSTTLTNENGMNLEKSSKYSISPEEALTNLTEFLNSEKNSTRGNNDKMISEVYPVILHSPLTRNSCSTTQIDTLLYVANFKDEKGYAILGADNRIPDKILAVTDNGSLSQDMIAASSSSSSQSQPTINPYPIDGPGFFTSPQYGDEVFINPNTVNFHIEAENDTLVGNYVYDLEDTSNSNNHSDNTENDAFIQEYTTSLCISYALKEVSDYNNNNDHPIIDDKMLPDDPKDPYPNITKTTSTDWCITDSKSPILKSYRTWHQSSPFNDYCPKRRSWVIVGHRKRAPAGCFPLAVAKIMTHFSKPTYFAYENEKVDWEGLKSTSSLTLDTISAALLLRGIGDECNSWYFYQGTFTFPNKVTAFLRKHGYSDAHSHDYSFDRVINMLNNGKPIIIYGLPGIVITSAHSWNIDGYKVKERTTTTKIYNSAGSLLSTSEKKESVNMVHCDFGWKGRCNGYYVSGIFKLNDPNVELDPSSESDKKTYYNTLIRIITYERPN